MRPLRPTLVEPGGRPSRHGLRGTPGAIGVLGTAALLALAAVHLGLGAAEVGLTDVLGVLTGEASAREQAVLLDARLPRTLAGVVAGVALGTSGVLIQGATRNPLAAPDTLGVNAGAYLAVVVVAVTGVDLGMLASGGVAFAGGLLAIAVVYALTAGGVLTPGRVLLAGATVMLAGTAAAQFLQILDENSTRGLYFWGQGSLLQSGAARPIVLGIIVLTLFLAALAVTRQLDLLALGDEAAEAMGLRVSRVRPALLLLAVLLAAAAVTVAGPIAFVGLIAPVAVRSLGLSRHALRLPASALAAAALVLAADAAAQLTLPASAGYGELPVGVVTAMIGGPVFVLLARRITTGDADVGAAVITAAPPAPARYILVFGLVAAIAAVAAAVGLRTGDVAISWSELVAVLRGVGDTAVEAIVAHRAPRVAVAAFAGACLAVAGVAVQAVVRNPIAEPNLIGITQGAAVAGVLVILAVPAAPAAVLPLAVALGGAGTLALVMLLAGERGRLDPTRVVLVGLGCGYTAQAVVHLLVLGSQMDLASALTWLSGSTYARDLSALGWLLAPAAVGILLAVAARPVDLLSLEGDLARGLGLPLARTRVLVLGAAAVLAAGTAAAVGTVGFVGLVAPHLARRIIGSSTARLVPVAALLGAVLVMGADAVGRGLLAPVEIPVGVVTAVIGAPYLVWLLRRTSTTLPR